MLHKLSTLALVTTILLLSVGEARATITAQAQVDGSVFLDTYTRDQTVWETAGGVGVTGLLGYRLELGVVALTPEVGFNYCWFTDPYARGTLRVLGGGRVALPWKVEPSAFVHVGWGRAEGIDGDAVLFRHGLTLDAGLALDYEVLNGWSIGLQAGYNTLVAGTGSGTDVDHWFSLGVHTGFAF
jgi:hypothetical protein